MRKFALIALFLTVFVPFSRPAQAETLTVDAQHTTVGFRIKHLLSYVQGRFNQFEGTIEYQEGKPETWSASGTIQAASIDTNLSQRDTHLKSADFFDVEKFPTISFKTTKATTVDATHAKVDGLITIHGIEKPVTLDVELLGTATDPWGNVATGFTAVTKFNRKDFGLGWNQALEAGGVLVGEEVQITLDIAATPKK